MRLNIRSIAFFAAAAAGLAACGGGGSVSGVGSLPTQAPPLPPLVPRNLDDYGIFAAPGINRLPIHEIKATNAELAQMVALVEYASIYDPERHPHLVSKIACSSFVKACDILSYPTAGDAPFSLVTLTLDPLPEKPGPSTDNLLEQLQPTTKLVSLSVEPVYYNLVERYGDTLPFALVQSAGNSGQDEFFHSQGIEEPGQEERVGIVFDPQNNTYIYVDGEPVRPSVRSMIWGIRAAAAADKVLYVSAYDNVGISRIVRHPEATGCVGVENACVYAPFEFELPRGSRERLRKVRGTSGSAPNVAMALTSVLAFFPETTGPDLIRLAKECANPEPGLSGLGVADFTCMTELGSRGEWRLISDAQFAGLISPATMSGLEFPGNATISGEFATGREGAKPVRLAMTRPSAFGVGNFSAGIQKTPAEGVSGYFPIAVIGEESGSIGGGYVAEEGFFAAAAVGRDDGFFGLGRNNDYGLSSTVDVSVGHRNLFVRASRQVNDGGDVFVNAAEGSAIGITAGGKHEIAPGLSMSAALHADRFIGGSAATAFGPVRIGRSPWSRRAELAFRRELGPNAAYAFGGTFSRGSDGTTAQKFRTEIGIKF